MTFTRVVAALLSVVMFSQPMVAFAQDAPPVVAPARPVIAGQLLHLDGKTPWTGKVVRVVDRTAWKVAAEVSSNAGGRFELPTLAPGDYLVVIGSLVSPLQVTADRPLRDMRIVASAAQMDVDTIPMADLSPTLDLTGTTMIFIVGMVVIVGLGVGAGAVIGYNMRDADKKIIFVSPSAP